MRTHPGYSWMTVLVLEKLPLERTPLESDSCRLRFFVFFHWLRLLLSLLPL